jgi:hypothetical protein
MVRKAQDTLKGHTQDTPFRKGHTFYTAKEAGGVGSFTLK